MMFPRLPFSLAVLTLLTFVGFGCGGPSYGTPVKVAGKVTVSGAPAKDVNVIFQATEKLPADKRTAQAEVDGEGKYEISGVYPADYQVFLQSTAPPDANMTSAMPVSAIPTNPDGTAITKSAKVPTGNNEFNFDF